MCHIIRLVVASVEQQDERDDGEKEEETFFPTFVGASNGFSNFM